MTDVPKDVSLGTGEQIPFGSYVLERRLAVGGMSEVFLARPREQLDGAPERVVLKRLLPELIEDDSVREAFELEAHIHARARHRNVVAFRELGSYAGEPFIAMEYVEGVDLSRIMRRARAEDRRLSVGMSVFVVREVLAALSHVHLLASPSGESLRVVHRDVTPTNTLMSVRGEVKLSDFGIARHFGRDTSLALKGKYAYLAPEQVAGESFDHRADLFAAAVVLAEMLIGGPLFAGAGQLAVLLAIRDSRIDALREKRDSLPSGLFEVLERALSRSASDRFGTARDFSLALAPFEVPSRGAARSELIGWVSYAADSASAARHLEGAVLETRALAAGRRLQAHVGSSVQTSLRNTTDKDPPRSSPPSKRATLPEEPVVCRLRIRRGEPQVLQLQKVIEMLVTGQLSGDDEVDLADGFHAIGSLAILARYLPSQTATTKQLEGPGVPDFTARLPESSLADALVWIARRRETGVLFADDTSQERPRTELYFEAGRLQLASSSERSTLLGEHLVARGLIDRSELDLAVLVMHKYNGHLGDTLIALGLAEPLDVFQAIKSQGHERVKMLFRIETGQFSFYRGILPTKNDFPLDLDPVSLLYAGLVSVSEREIATQFLANTADVFACAKPLPDFAKERNGWPPAVTRMFDELATPRPLDDLLRSLCPTLGDAKSEAELRSLLVGLQCLLRLEIVQQLS